MASPHAAAQVRDEFAGPSTAKWILASMAAAVAAIHIATNGRYGFHRDELQTLSDAMHLDWGFVAYPPLTPFLERIGLGIFGVSLVGLRMFSVIAQAAVLVITGLMTKELGGARWAQATAALAVAVSPLPMFEATEFQYSSFDYLWWVLIAYFVIRALKSEDARWCVPIGAVIGIGLLTKYSMAFYVAGVVVGLLLTWARRFLATRWFWMGLGLAFVIFLPNLIWQVRHDFISLHFLQYIHKRDVGQGRAEGFWRLQFVLCTNRFAVPLWIAGLIAFLFSRRYRMLAWMYLTPLLVFWLTKGRFYYVGAAYPMLIAMGAATVALWLERLPRLWRSAAQGAYVVALLAWGAMVATVIMPLSWTGPLFQRAMHENGDLREEIGWNELVKTVAAIRDSLPPQQQQGLGVLVGNYGEQGAIEILGRAYHLPMPISGTNSAWLRSYPAQPPSMLIVIGFGSKSVERNFTSCRLAAHNTNLYSIHNEESADHPDIFVCSGPRLPWSEFWKEFQSFG